MKRRTRHHGSSKRASPRGRQAPPPGSGQRSSGSGSSPLRARRAPAPAAKEGRSDPPDPPAETLYEAELDAVATLQRHRLTLSHTIRSSGEYWASVHRVLELRAELEAAEGRFREVYDFIPIPFLVLDGALRIISANTAARALIDEERGIPVGRHLRALLDLDSYVAVDDGLDGAGPPRMREAKLRTDRGLVPVQLTAHAVDYTKPGLPRRRTVYVACVDMSEVRRLEEERRRLEVERQRSEEAERIAREANHAKDEFLAMLSHELRTPLTPILAAVSAIDAGVLPPSLHDAVAAIRRNVVAEARLIDDLLDVARIRQRRLSIEKQRFRLHELLEQVLEDWRPEAERRRLRMEVELLADHDHVEGDPARLAQVFRNLLGNAAKFTEPDGRILVRTLDGHSTIRVSVEDTGAGMTPDQLQHLFQPFADTSSPWDPRAGLGLGLVISRGIVDAHGGRIFAHSEGPGRGTRLEVNLRTVPAPATEEATRPLELERAPVQPHLPRRKPAPAPEPAPSPKLHVLLVEDHADSAETLSMVLAMKGYEVTVAPTLAAARQQAGCCQLLVSDISLPDGSGLELMRELRRDREVPGIALSGFGTDDDVRRSREAGFEEHLIKPVDIDQLLAAIERVAGRLQVTEGSGPAAPRVQNPTVGGDGPQRPS